MTPAAYREKFTQELTDTKLLEYFDLQTKRDGGTIQMLRFPEGEWVTGGAWPGNYGRVSIIDYRTYTVPKGRRKITLPNGDTDYEDWDGMNDLVIRDLPTTAQNIQREVARKRTSFYNMPHRFGEKYMEHLLCKIGDTVCQGSQLTEEMLAEVLAEMTPFERSKYEQSLYKIDVTLYPSVEQPVKVRIDGNDDGAEEALFPDMESARDALEDIAWFNSHDRRHHTHGFQGTD